ncbi:MAG: TerB family tellurite resistance protein [Pseudomonadota bacterium]
MFDAIKSFFASDENTSAPATLDLTDVKLCSAALLVQVLTADGVKRPAEEEKLRDILQTRYGLSADETEELYKRARTATNSAVDLYGFTSTLKRELDEEARINLVRHLWDIVYSDGQLHELEDNVVWRIAELLAVSSRDRMLAKQDAVRDAD